MPTFTAPAVDRDRVLRFEVEVADENDEIDVDAVNVTVQAVNEPPTGAFTYPPSNPEVGSGVGFDAADSFDPDGTIVSYALEFGDGGIASGTSPTHTYEAAGDFDVTLTVTDNGGTITAVTQTVTVDVFATPIPVGRGAVLPQDPDGDGLYDDVSATVS